MFRVPFSTHIKWMQHLMTMLTALLICTAGLQAQERHTPTVVGALTLDQCIDVALQRNSSVLIAKGQVDQFEGSSLSSWSSMTPQISATIFNGARNIQGDAVFTGEIQEPQPDGSVIFRQGDIVRSGQTRDNFFAGLSVNQLIYDGGASWNQIKQARQNTRTAVLNETATKSQVILDVSQQYYNLLKAVRQYEVREELVRLNSEQLRQSETMYRLGTVAKVDVLRARATLGSARVALASQGALIRRTKGALNTVMGRTMNASLEIVDTVDPEVLSFSEPVSIDRAIASAMESNPSIRNREAQVQSARLGKKIARGGLFPQISGFFNYNRNNTELNRVYNNFDQNWSMSFGVTLRLNLLNGTRTYGNISQASASFYVAEETLEQQKRQTILAIEQAFADLESSREIIALSRESIEAAEESLRLEQSRYRVGTGRQLDVIDAQLRFIQAKFSLVSALYDYKIAEASLDNAMGVMGGMN